MQLRPTLPTLLVLTGLTLGIYVWMLLGPLSALQTLAGAPPLDMRPFGYDRDGVAAFLHALGHDGRTFYLTRQIPLDMIYPGLLALMLAGWLRWLGRRGAAIAVTASLCDYAENGLIVWMLLTFPHMPEGLAKAASIATMLKSGLSTVAFSWLLIVAGISVYRNRARRRVPPAQRTASAGTKPPRYG